MRIKATLEDRRRDLTLALRQLRQAPGFTLAVVATLALGIGVTSATFGLADAALLRPLPFRDPDRLMLVWERRPNGFTTMASPEEFSRWAARSRTFAGMAALAAGGGLALSGRDGAELIPSQTVTRTFFEVLGVRPIAGRTFAPADGGPSPNVVVMSERLWRRRFAADPGMVGRSLVLGGTPMSVVGIVPADVQLVPPFASGGTGTSEPTGIWIMAADSGPPAARQAHYVHVIARLAPGVSRDGARRDMEAVADAIARESPATNAGHGIEVEPLRDALIGREVQQTSRVLLGVVVFLLLMCCANVANLLLARAGAREREIAVRAALGATRRRLVAQLLTESLTLAVIGGGCGLVIGAAILRAVPAVIPPGLLPNAVVLALDRRIALFAAVVTVAVGLLFGIAPALKAMGASLAQAVASGARTTRLTGALPAVMVAGQIACAVLVLSGAGLLLRTLAALSSVDPGSANHNLLTAAINLPFPGPQSPERYRTPDAPQRFYEAVERDLRRQPGVRRVAWGSVLPFDGWWFGQPFSIEGDQPMLDGNRSAASYHMVSAEYFDTLGIRIVRGRPFAAGDAAESRPVCIVSEAFARQFLRGEPMGARVRVPKMSFGSPDPVIREVVGVARQVKGEPGEPRDQAQIYVPLAQNAWSSASLIVEPVSGQAAALTGPVRAALARVDPDIPLRRVRTIDTIAAAATERPRFRAVMVAVLAALALALAGVGIFGVLAYAVAQRTRELGVRVALGASRADVLALVLGRAARMVGAGGVVGLLLALWLGRSLALFLFGVRPVDPITAIAVAVMLVLTATLAAAAPALRAVRVDPSVAFRAD